MWFNNLLYVFMKSELNEQTNKYFMQYFWNGCIIIIMKVDICFDNYHTKGLEDKCMLNYLKINIFVHKDSHRNKNEIVLKWIKYSKFLLPKVWLISDNKIMLSVSLLWRTWLKSKLHRISDRLGLKLKHPPIFCLS